MVSFDVGGSLKTNGKFEIKMMLFLLCYQLTIIMGFLLSFIPFIGHYLGKIIIFLLSLIKVFSDNEIPSWMVTDPRRMNYPYFYFYFGNWPPILFQKNYIKY